MKRLGSDVIIEIDDVIKPEKVDEYKKELKVVYQQLIAIANNLIVMERLSNFPYHLFVAEDRRVFWLLTNKAFFDSTVLAFSTVLARGGKSITLRSLKTKIMNPQEFRIDDIDERVLQILKHRIDDSDFEKTIKSPENQIRAVRNHHIAHLDYNVKMGNVTPPEIVPYSLPLDVLKQALDVSNKLFQILGLSVSYQLEFWDYVNSTQKLDIDEILELVAGSSFWFCDDPRIYFEAKYEKLSDKDKAILDEWREKLGKS